MPTRIPRGKLWSLLQPDGEWRLLGEHLVKGENGLVFLWHLALSRGVVLVWHLALSWGVVLVWYLALSRDVARSRSVILGRDIALLRKLVCRRLADRLRNAIHGPAFVRRCPCIRRELVHLEPPQRRRALKGLVVRLVKQLRPQPLREHDAAGGAALVPIVERRGAVGAIRGTHGSSR